jgi:integrase
MSEHREKPVVDPEAWAAAQVEEVVKDLEKKQKRIKRTPPPKVRGVFFRLNPKGQVKDHVGRMGDWWIRWTDTTGKEHREKCGSRPAALDLYGKRRAEVRMGHHFPESMRKVRGTTLQDVCNDYADTLKANGRDPREQTKMRLTEVVGILGDIAAKNITPQDVEKVKARLLATPARGRKDPEDPERERPRTPASVNRYLQDLRAAYNLARRNGLVDKNPVADVKLLRENNKRVREMTASEETAILTALEPSERRFHTDLRPMVRFLTATGLRLGEACNLRWADVDWPAGVATLRKTKAGKVQHVPLSSEAVAILRALGPHDGDACVFAWPDGRPWTPGYVTHAFGGAVEDAGVKDLHVHDLRHSFACRLLRGGVDIYAVSKLLRHASVVMSERYAHLSQSDLKAAVERKSMLQTGTPTGTYKSEAL